MYTKFFKCLLLFVLTAVLVSAGVAQQREPRTQEELDQQLLWLLDQRDTPSVATIQQLLDKGARVNARIDDGTTLMLAVRWGHAEIVKLLLAAGAEVDAKHRLGDSALIMSARRSIPEMNPPRGQPLPPPASEIMSLLLAKGADVNLIGHDGHTALMEANSTAKVKLLVAHGAQVNTKDEESKTALMYAVDRGEVEVVEALLQAGADASVVDEEGATALMHALEEPPPYNPEESAKLKKRRIEAARVLLLRGNVGNINAQNEDGETLLMRAVNLGEAELVTALLDRGADANLSDVLGRTALVLAYEKDQTSTQELLKRKARKRQPRPVLNAFLLAAIGKKDSLKVKELLKAGAEPNYEYSIGYRHRDIKSTALILAAQTGDAAVVQMLLAAGANVEAKGLLQGSEHGLVFGTALEAAESAKNTEVVNLLSQFHAKAQRSKGAK